MNAHDAYVRLCEAAKQDSDETQEQESASSKVKALKDKLSKASIKLPKRAGGTATNHGQQAAMLAYQQHQAMMDADRVNRMNMSLAASGGMNPFMFGC